MVRQIYHSELQLNKVKTSDTEAAFKTCICPFLMLLFLPKLMIKVTILILKFPFLDCDVPLSTSYRIYISQLFRFARASSHIADYNTRNKLLTKKLFKLVSLTPQILSKFYLRGSFGKFLA